MILINVADKSTRYFLCRRICLSNLNTYIVTYVKGHYHTSSSSIHSSICPSRYIFFWLCLCKLFFMYCLKQSLWYLCLLGCIYSMENNFRNLGKETRARSGYLLSISYLLSYGPTPSEQPGQCFWILITLPTGTNNSLLLPVLRYFATPHWFPVIFYTPFHIFPLTCVPAVLTLT